MKYALCMMAGILLLVSGCADHVPEDALKLSSESLADRQLQSRRFETRDEIKLLTAGAQVLQDIGYNIEETATPLGVITASKDADAMEAGQVAGAVALALLFGSAVAIENLDNNQKIRVSLVTQPKSGSETAVRVTFQRIVWNTNGKVTKTEFLNNPQLYQEFFNKMSQSVFLTANEI